jgi:tetratricopeptide (TPR) repeat protein
MPRTTLLPLLFVFLATYALPAYPQEKQKPDPSEAPDSNKPATSSSAQPQQDSSAKYDPFPAEQDVEVGTFYMHKGDLDAAIGRFQDAIRLRANFAKPRILLAEVYEKKGEKASAAKYYKEYLQVFPDAPDAKKIRQKIDKLTSH